MPKGSEQLTAARREEIINACETLYQTMGFKEITIKEIGSVTSFTRTSVYNYFQTKEEIFLALLGREYQRWIADLECLTAEHGALSADEFARALAHTMEPRVQLFKLLCMNLFEMEENSRVERLVEFKLVYCRFITALQDCLDQFCPQMTGGEKQEFIYHFLPFVYGLYPYTTVTEKQRQAMEQAGMHYIPRTIFGLAYGFIKRLLTANQTDESF